MKKLTLEQWEKKYVRGDIKRFDQRYTMFNRPGWDKSIHGAVDSWAITGTTKDKPGYYLEDWALHWASRRGTLFGLFNTSKPNPSKSSIALMKAMASIVPSGQTMMPRQPPEGARLHDPRPDALTTKIKKAALWFGADLVGICRLDRRWVYSHTYDAPPYSGKKDDELLEVESVPQEVPEEYQWAVVMCFEQSYDLVSYYPTLDSNAASSMGYSRMAITNHYLSAFIRNMGYKAIDCTTNDVALSIPMAMQAGLGDIGRHGLLITPTDLPLIPDSPIDFGVTEFCEACMICAEKCPSQSILYGQRTTEPNSVSNVGGALKWPINAETCRMYWGRKNQGCTVCMACCPYNKPDTAFHRMVRWFTDHARWGDRFYVRMDKVFGYGKPRPADRFWEEWDPKRKFKPWE
ncbi:MAG: reductive dehalogenase [Deltaproteobacteria bacterium]|nr:reductive dehalogenase [Deltaproteobacteria bacterium]